jgi:hypothetical protein
MRAGVLGTTPIAFLHQLSEKCRLAPVVGDLATANRLTQLADEYDALADHMAKSVAVTRKTYFSGA